MEINICQYSLSRQQCRLFSCAFFTICTYGIPKSLRVCLDNGGFIVQNLLILSHNSKKFRLMAGYDAFFRIFAPIN